ncbi:Protein kinase-like domain [Apiospora hydei]|uniref:Protein kinase-like domain n=1 Tax=Apiospora hydei TaxID=1337664 RepID=A0ABR1XEF9_9PEZI
MANTRPNQEGFHRRLEAVQAILRQYGLTSAQVTPVAYVEHCPFMFNNYIFKVDLAAPATPSSFPGNQPCTTPPPPAGVSSLIVRMSNPLAEGLNNANRVENDVAASYLIRQSVTRAGLAPVVPAVFAWAPNRFPDVAGEAGFGWTMAEFKPGADLDAQFPTLDRDAVNAVLEQLADLVVAVQRVDLPSGAARFGALTIDAQGAIVSGQMPLLKGGPWDTYAETWVAKLKDRLAESDQSSLLKGWRESGIRERIDKYISAGGVQLILEPVDNNQKILNHGDLTLNNLLYDSDTQRITGLLDFDWAAVTHPCDEFLFGLWDIGGGIHERVGDLQPYIISGDFSQQPDGLSEEEVRKWETAKAWDGALARRGAIRPSSIAGVDRIQALRGLEELLCPFALASEVMLGRISDAEKVAKKEEAGVKITDWLDRWAD